MLNKQDILEEIRRTAKENGDIPLGSKRFEDKTGITSTDWGRYWPRFGDAQREAGFTANTLQVPYKDDYLFEKFILLIRELHKFPTTREIVVKTNSDADFPSRNAFFRLGAKQKLAAKLLDYATDKKYSDVVKICLTVLEKFNTKEESEKNLSNEKLGSVYLVKSGRYYKIGRTNDMGRRHHEITVQLPEGLELIHEIKTDDPSGIEAYWHNRFESKHKNGEWFDLNSSDIRAFKRWRRII